MTDTDHKKLAGKYFNETWDLIDKKDRSEDEKFEMIHKAHASRFHWGLAEAGTATNIATGEWQISRVYAILGLAESSLLHGKRCLDFTLKEKLGAFNVAFGYEAVARAFAAAGNDEARDENIRLGLEAAEGVEDKEDKAWVLSQLNDIRV
jgi:hypothetical protein